MINMVQDKDTNLGKTSKIEEGIILNDEDKIINTIPLQNAPIYGMKGLDTVGLGNIGGYEKKHQMGIIHITDPNNKKKKKSIHIYDDVKLTKEDEGKYILTTSPDVPEGTIIDSLNMNPKVPRVPRILAFNSNISSSDALKVIIETNNKIIDNNQNNQRIDTLNIVAIPEEELFRRSIIGEVEKKIFGTFGIKSRLLNQFDIDSITNKVKVNPVTKIPLYKYNLPDSVKLIKDTKEKIELNRIEIQTIQQKLADPKKNPRFNIRLNKGKIVQLEQENNKLFHDLQDKLKLPHTILVNHPYKKVWDAESHKLIPKKIRITDIEYDLISDYEPKDRSIYGDKNNKIFIKSGKAEIWDKDHNIEKVIDIGKEYQFNDPQVLDNILAFNPEQNDLTEMEHKTVDTSTSGTIRIGTNTQPLPSLGEKVKSILYDPTKNPELAQWANIPKNKIKLEKFLDQLGKYEQGNAIIPQISCEVGQIPLRRKRSPQAWGMTPKQKSCDVDLVSQRLEHRKNVYQKIYDEIKMDKNNKNQPDSAIKGLAEKLTEQNLLYDPEYKRIAGCDTQDDKQQAEIIQQTNIDIEDQNRIIREENREIRNQNMLHGTHVPTQDLIPLVPYVKFPMRFPTKNAMGDTTYCKSLKNIKPNVEFSFEPKPVNYTAKQIKAMELLGEKIPQPKWLSIPEINFKESGEKKKTRLILKKSANYIEE